MDLGAFEATATRCGVLLIVGIVGLGWLSGYTANPARRGPVSLWLIVPVLGAEILIIAGGAVMGRMVGEATTPLGWFFSPLLGTCAVISTLWASFIALQFAQNFFYRKVGAPTQPIRWIEGQNTRRRKAKGRKS